MSVEFQYTELFYNKMVELSESETHNGVKVRVYKGSLTKLYRGMGIGQSYYSKIMASLKRMGCVSMIQRGARTIPSVIVLHHAPDRGEWEAHHRAPDLTGRLEGATLAARVSTLESRLGGINIAQTLEIIEVRLDQLERALKTAEEK